jgi:hypothetical protein
MCRVGNNGYAHPFDFKYNNFGDVFSIVKKRPSLVNFSISHCGKYYFSQYSTPLVGMRFCRYIPSSLRNKNRIMHHPCLLEKVVFWTPKLCCPPLAQGKKTFSSTLNFIPCKWQGMNV